MCGRRDDRRPVANILRFPAHPVIASAAKIGNALYPDFIGALRGQFEREFGSTAIFLQGPCADIRPLHEQYGVEAADAYGRRLAGEAGKAGQGSALPAARAGGDRAGVSTGAIAAGVQVESCAGGEGVGGDDAEVRGGEGSSQAIAPGAADGGAAVGGVPPGDTADHHPAGGAEEGDVGDGGIGGAAGRAVVANLPGEIFASTGVAVREALGKGAAGGPVMVTELGGAVCQLCESGQRVWQRRIRGYVLLSG